MDPPHGRPARCGRHRQHPRRQRHEAVRGRERGAGGCCVRDPSDHRHAQVRRGRAADRVGHRAVVVHWRGYQRARPCRGQRDARIARQRTGRTREREARTPRRSALDREPDRADARGRDPRETRHRHGAHRSRVRDVTTSTGGGVDQTRSWDHDRAPRTDRCCRAPNHAHHHDRDARLHRGSDRDVPEGVCLYQRRRRRGAGREAHLRPRRAGLVRAPQRHVSGRCRLDANLDHERSSPVRDDTSGRHVGHPDLSRCHPRRSSPSEHRDGGHLHPSPSPELRRWHRRPTRVSTRRSRLGDERHRQRDDHPCVTGMTGMTGMTDQRKHGLPPGTSMTSRFSSPRGTDSMAAGRAGVCRFGAARCISSQTSPERVHSTHPMPRRESRGHRRVVTRTAVSQREHRCR